MLLLYKVEFDSITNLIVANGQFSFAIVTAYVSHGNVGQTLYKACVFAEERLLSDAWNFAVNCFAGQRVHHLNIFRANGPVDAEIGCFNLITCLGRCDERKFWLV